MPLPGNQPWPPKQLETILPALGAWSAWYSGDTDELSAVYGGRVGNDPSRVGFFASDHGGFKATVGRAITRWFWGEPTRGPDRRMKLHVPVAADLCQASADLLFSDELTLTVGNTRTQDRLDELAADSLYTKLAEAAEVAAALGGVYVRVSWDRALSDAPFLTSVDSDQALPEFSYDRLTAVTFWQIIARDGKTVWRHLERHECDLNGVGHILHGLYEGNGNELGHRAPLTARSETAPLALLVDENSAISTQSQGLAVAYVPNQRPQRRWRTDPLGKSLGRSDLDGVESLMDALDETYSSWMRDLRLGKARIMVARSLLESNGKGNGASFDADQEVYAPLDKLSNSTDKGLPIEQVQFNIRVVEHQATALQLVEDILRAAGYSNQTFGEGDTGSIRTATEIESRERRSLLTRDRKVRLWRPAIEFLLEKLLAVDAAIFNSGVTPETPDVGFPAGVQETQLALAQTAAALYTAQAASTQTLVQMLHPDWDDTAVQDEVQRIHNEQSAHVPDPTTFAGFGQPADPGTPDPTQPPA